MVEDRKPRPSGRGAVTGSSLIAWRQRLGLNRLEAAKSLQIARNTYQGYEEGKQPIPRHIALACAAIAHGLPPIE